MRLMYLPPYSPDLNPTEEGFSALKAWLRANREFVRAELMGEINCDPISMLWEAVYASLTPENAHRWYKDSGYL
ncbi:hypothetical protein FIBSPDRAFT_723534 [Athelia psychrophila]|uniref:Tc1-like transposase DDE domain-containing protein n=1 Tax=Athelia psychrophila TaxID=1759441 RepID=A0A166URD1_9AGAM|nr:hypothetical protein FIBSPDRAFT_723534 [Fibularhizoctonia sp. CBS 109695]